MSQFSNQLQVALEHARMTRTELSSAAKIPYRTLSNYAADINRPDAAVVSQICEALPEEERAALIAARVMDECPPKFRHLLLIIPRDGSLREEAAPLSDIPMPEQLRRNLEKIARAAVENEAWSRMVNDLAGLL